MGIKFYCPNGDRLHVKSFLSGKRAICPKCGAKVIVPAESQLSPGAKPADDEGSDPSINVQPNTESAAMPPTMDTLSQAPDAVWYVRPPTGGQFGPATSDIMRTWINEGRVAPTALVWRSGWSDWRSAAAGFPELATGVAPVAVAARREIPAATTSPPASEVSPAAAPVQPVHDEPFVGTASAPGRDAENEFVAPIMEIATADAADPTRRVKRRGAKGNELWLSVTLVVITLVLLGALVVVLMRSSDTVDEPTAPTATTSSASI